MTNKSRILGGTFAVLLVLGSVDVAFAQESQGQGQAQSEQRLTREETLMAQAKEILVIRGREYCAMEECTDEDTALHMLDYIAELERWVKLLKQTEQYKNKDIKFLINDALSYSYDFITKSSRHYGGYRDNSFDASVQR